MSDREPGQSAIREAIRASLPGLRPAEERVASVLLAEPDAVIKMSVSDLAQHADTSVATVVRCCQALGFSGFHELKIGLARSAGLSSRQSLGDVEEGDDAAAVVTKVFGASARALNEATDALDAEVLAQVAGLLAAAERVIVAGVGTSGPLAADAAYRLMTIGVDATAPADAHVQHVRARLLRPSDACIVVSHTGSTSETLNVARAAADAGAVTVAITSFRSSPLTEIVDHVIVAGSHETAFRIEATASRLVHVAVIDALVVLLTLHRRDAAAEAMDLSAQVLSGHRI
jgi:DNA-binding MurR/RpiR family transcriptional regulator